ncbi:MAG TPA: MerR family transcriptional regulator [Bacteroidota bacterium]|nr:MerR family transcriptional regulator [Bacteroidota bacterium]
MKRHQAYKYPIRLASEMSGVSVYVIRAWEKRHRILSPERTTSNRRLYSDRDIERLILLRQLIESGHSIGELATLSSEALMELLAKERTGKHVPNPGSSGSSEARDYQGDMLAAVRALDVRSLEDALTQASLHLSQQALIGEVIAPFLESIGRHWQEGTIRIAHEHLATAAVRTFLGSIVASAPRFPNAPTALVCTPVNQLHELGALFAAATVATRGWNVVYLGANLPAEEVAAAVHQLSARMLILGIVFPADDAVLHRDLRRLATLLPDDVAVAAGGRAAGAYAAALASLDAVIIRDLDDLGKLLDIRSAGVSPG